MPNLYKKLICALAMVVSAGAQDNSGQIEPNAGSWKTWVLKSGSELRLPVPNMDKNSTASEMASLKDFIAASIRSPEAMRQLRYWTSGPPAYRWIELITSQIDSKPLARPPRALALFNVAMYDATIAGWDSKYAYKRPRPSEADSSVAVTGLAPRSPSYPSELAVTSAAASEMLAFFWPADAQYFRDIADGAANASMAAGFNYATDVTAGLQLGRAVAARVIEWSKNDGSDAVWTGSVPTEPGLWNGTNPVEPLFGTWKTWVLSSGDQFRAPPPFAYNSPEKQAELADVKNYPRSPTAFATNEKALYYQAVEGVTTFWYANIGQRLFESKLDSNPPRAARAYALAAIAYYDAEVACWDSKYTYWAIRPFQLDPTITPLFTTPNHPSYPAAHGCGSGALGRVIGRLFPDYADFMEAKANEAAESRLWGGIHYRSDLNAGLAIGRKVGDLVMEKAATDGSQ